MNGAPNAATQNPINGLMMAVAAANPEGPSEFVLVADRYPKAVGLPDVLENLSKTPEGRATIKSMFDVLKANTGVEAPPALIEEAQRNPRKMMQALEMSPKEMSAAIAQVDRKFKAGEVKNPVPVPNILPGTKFNFADFASIVSPERKPALKDLGSNIFTGTVPSDTSDAQVKKNRVMAEVFQRLTSNTSESDPSKQFEVTYKGKAFNRLNDFVDALKADGYQLDVSFESRVANFTEMHLKVDGPNGPEYRDVPAPLMVKTGYTDGSGRMAMVPASHSEMIISVKGGPNPDLTGDLKFFQGMSGTGFFPANVTANASWLGKGMHGAYSGDAAIKAIKVAGAFTDLIHTVGKEQNLYAEGYGQTGVCDDSIAVIHQVVEPGKGNEYYPLLMQDNLLTAAIGRKLADSDLSNDSALRELQAAIAFLPSDLEKNPTDKQRALKALPWASEQDPFFSTGLTRWLLGR